VEVNERQVSGAERGAPNGDNCVESCRPTHGLILESGQIGAAFELLLGGKNGARSEKTSDRLGLRFAAAEAAKHQLSGGQRQRVFSAAEAASVIDRTWSNSRQLLAFATILNGFARAL
tara:strand:- start:1846 stop:2199 length:354 start_codon:yes stop_codon:yes gene_type:complete